MLTLYIIVHTLLLLPLRAVIRNTEYGPVEGGQPFAFDPAVTFPNLIDAFIGLPYAKPPVSSLRFKSPEPASPYSIAPYPANGNIDLIAACPDPVPCTFGYPFCPVIVSEDCLTLNIYVPSNAIPNEALYPVMIWIHGGKFETSWSTQYWFDPLNLMHTEPVIVVTINYRLGILGTLYDNMYNTKVNGNFNILDQSLAIKYVYHNIVHFGGNPEQITLFGESAGAHSVGLHLLYNNEYIAGGIMQSAPFGLELRNPTSWNDVALQFSNKIGCDTSISSIDLLECWQNAELSLILDAQLDPALLVTQQTEYYYHWTPTVGTDLLPNDVLFEFANIAKGANINKIPPFIIGTNKDEGYLFINEGDRATTTYSDIVNKLSERLGNNPIAAHKVLDYYGITEISKGASNDYLYSYADIITDHDYKCAMKNVLKNAVKRGKVNGNIYTYSLEAVDAGLNQIVLPIPQCITRTCHAWDLFVVFTNGRYRYLMDMFGPNTVKLSEQIQTWWTNFAFTLDPNNPNSGDNEWPNYVSLTSSSSSSEENESNDNALRIIGYEDYIKAIINDPDDNELCAFWDKIGYSGNYKNYGNNGNNGNNGNHGMYVESAGSIKSIHDEMDGNKYRDIIIRSTMSYYWIGLMCLLIISMIFCAGLVCGKYLYSSNSTKDDQFILVTNYSDIDSQC